MPLTLQHVCQLIAAERGLANVPAWLEIGFPGQRFRTVRDVFYDARSKGQWDVDLMLDRHDDLVCWILVDQLSRHGQREPIQVDWDTLCRSIGVKPASGSTIRFQLVDAEAATQTSYSTKNGLRLVVGTAADGVACWWSVAYC